MTFGQRVRRFLYRLRRRFAPGADNAPIVTLEHAPAAPMVFRRRRVRSRIERYLRMAAGFALSIILLGGAAMYLVEEAGAPQMDLTPALTAPQNGSQGLAAAYYLFALRGERRGGVDADRLFASAALLAREDAIFRASERVAEAYVENLMVKRGAHDPLLLEAQSLAGNAEAARLASVERLGQAVARGQVRLDDSPAALRTLMRRAADDCAASAATLGEGPTSPDIAFNEARGTAFGWLLVLRGAAADAGALRTPEYARLMAMLERAAGRRPNLFLRPIGGGPFAPDHVSAIALDLALAAQAASALAAR